jgi:acetyl esterase/lipase
VPARLRRLLALTFAVVLALATACGGSDTDTAQGEGETAAAPRLEVDPADLEPDALPDPQVAPGTCEIVTYTPPTAREPERGEICRPSDDQRNVAVMVLHGGSGIGGSYQGMRSWADRLVAEGYVTFLPDYHLFTPGGSGPVFPRPEQNVKAAVQYLRGTARALGVSRRNLVVQGMSAGARLGAVAYTTPDDAWFEGPELWPDIPDTVNGFIGFYHTYDGTMQFSTQYYGGPDDSSTAAVRERWDKADAMANAAGAVGPALFVTGSRDWDLIEAQQQQFAVALHDAGLDARTVVIDGGSHGFDTGTATRLSRLGEKAAVEVLRWLNDEFPQEPARPATSADIDLATAPDRSGEPPTTYATRRRPSTARGTTTTTRATSSTTTTLDQASSTTASTTTTSTADTSSTSSSTTTTQASPDG